jgi:GntR family transcriptional regulator/MocR family aminotransferase
VWLDLDAEGPLYQQAYRALRIAILDGALSPGDRLPASRSLARDARLSRNTVLQAYEQLVDEGYAVAKIGSGTYVAAVVPDDRSVSGGVLDSGATRSPSGTAGPRVTTGPQRTAGKSPELSLYAERMLAGAPRGPVAWDMPRRHLPYDFRYGEPAYADLPLETWCRLLGRRARRASASRLAYGDPAGAPELRRALATYLRRARGVSVTPEQILITQGTQQAIDLVARVLVNPGDRVVLEEPSYRGFSLALGAHGAHLDPVPVDSRGLRVDALIDRGPARGVCVTPSHQFPTGGVLPLERRLALLDWAVRHGAFVLEDDYDGEYRYENRPIPSLQGLDRSECVLYVGSASKLLFPSMRLGWLVVPEPLVRAFSIAKAYADTGSATLEQLVLAEFIEGGHLERHVRRSRVRNAARRTALQDAVDRHLSGVAELEGTRAGLHGLLWVSELPGTREAELRRRCEARGVGIYPVHPYYAEPPDRAGFVLGYAGLGERDIETGIRELASALAEVPPGPGAGRQ